MRSRMAPQDEGFVLIDVDNIPISAILRSLFTQEGTLPERSVAGWGGGACAGGVPLRRTSPEPRVPSPPGRRCPEGADEGDAGRNQDRDLANARHRGPHPSASPPPSPIGRRKTRVAFRGSRGSRPHQDRIVIPSSTSIPSSSETQSEAANLFRDEGCCIFYVDNIPICAILRSLFTQEGTLPERSVAGWRGGA